MYWKDVSECCELLVAGGYRSVTKFIDTKLRVRASRVLTRGKIDKRDRGLDIRVTIDKPNFQERAFIKGKTYVGEEVLCRPLPKKRSKKPRRR
jgi:hypothetical protein